MDVALSKAPEHATSRYFSSPNQNMAERTVREVRTVTEGGQVRQIITESRSSGSSSGSSSMAQNWVGPDRGTVTTKRVITSSDGSTRTIITTGDPSHLPEEFAKQLQLGGDQKWTTTKKITSSSGSPSLITRDFMSTSQPSSNKPSSVNVAASRSETATTSKKGAEPKSAAAFRQECLDVHNNYRAKHGVPPLRLSIELNAYAEEWVNKLAKEDKMQHRTNNKYGENIFMKWSSDPTFQISGADPVDSWYSEIKDHVFGKEPRTLASGHFSQVIWKTTKEMGVAQAKSKSGKILVVANYAPAGNMIGSFTANVPPPKK